MGPVGVLWLLNINKTDELRDESDDEKVDVNVLNYYLNLKALVLMFGVWRNFVNAFKMGLKWKYILVVVVVNDETT